MSMSPPLLFSSPTKHDTAAHHRSPSPQTSTTARPLTSLSGAQQNSRTGSFSLSSSPKKNHNNSATAASPAKKTSPSKQTPTLGSPKKHRGAHRDAEEDEDDLDLFDVTTTSTKTTKSSHVVEMVNGQVVRDEYNVDVDGDQSAIDFDDTAGLMTSSPFREVPDQDTGVLGFGKGGNVLGSSPSKKSSRARVSMDRLDDSMIHHDQSTPSVHGTKEQGDRSNVYSGTAATGDETEMTFDVGDLSTFSAVPNVDMTFFAGIRGASPTKTLASAWSPSKQLRTSVYQTPATTRRGGGGGSPIKTDNTKEFDGEFDDDEDDDVDLDATPRRGPAQADTTDLLNFTGQTDIFIPPPQQSATRTSRRSPSGRGAFPVRVSPTKSQAQIERERAAFQTSSKPMAMDGEVPGLETPARARNGAGQRNNLLDLDIDPLPTPRSVPTITPRELESLRSELTSQISALRATLSGKDAEVSALKRAITDAEARCGTALEDVRNEKIKVENLESERDAWGRRQGEMEGILRDVRQEVLVRSRDAEKAERKVEEMEKKVGDWEGKNRELEAQVETLRRRVAAAATAASGTGGDAEMGDVTKKLMDVDASVKDATERVARELHALYKGKHESKVAALKKSYEARWEKRVKELEKSLKEAADEVVQLKTERDATISGPVRHDVATEAEKEKMREEAEKLEAEKKMLEARIQGLESELVSTKEESDVVRSELEKQRSENGELVAAIDEMLALQDEMGTTDTSSMTSQHTSTLQSGLESLRGSIQRSSHPHPYTASTPRSAIKTRNAPVNTTGLGLKLPQPTTRTTGIPTSASSMSIGSESRIGRAPMRVGAARGGRSRSGSRTRVGGTTAGLREGIARMGAGR